MPPVNAKPVSLLVVIAVLIWSCGVEAAPIRVRLIEGNFRGFLVLRSLDGAAIAYGEVSQKPMGKLAECRTILRFKDGSLYDDPRFRHTEHRRGERIGDEVLDHLRRLPGYSVYTMTCTSERSGIASSGTRATA